MERTILGFRQDDAGEWVADLSCLHRQHIRHRPPFRVAPWVLDDAERAGQVGSALDCSLCDRVELPDDLHVVRATDVWNEETMPSGLRRRHRVAAGTWGRLQVQEGELRFRLSTQPALDLIVRPDCPQPIPPEVDHEVEPLGRVRFFVEFLRRSD
jgi:tellurite resistance-related uncharacterized protein